jgi:hypothetical protein
MYHSASVLCAVALLSVTLLQQDLPEVEITSTPGIIGHEDPPPHRNRARQPVELRDNALAFSDRFSLTFQRTLRIPDDGGTYPLPPGLGAFPVYRVSDFADRVPGDWDHKNGYFIPMYQREAMWIDFDGAWWKPNAVKVGVGLVNAVSGGAWNLALDDDPQDYVVVPDQPWLDGIKSGEGTIRQFVAVPLGSGYSVEAQVTGEESDGALHIAVFEPKAGRFPDHPPQNDRYVVHEEQMSAMAMKMDGASMGVGAGGRMKQKVYEDGYGLDTWQQSEPQWVVIYIINSKQFEAITGLTPPTTPVDATTYTSYGFPWFDLYDENKSDLPASGKLKNVKSTGELDKQKGISKQSDSSIVVPDSQVIKLK